MACRWWLPVACLAALIVAAVAPPPEDLSNFQNEFVCDSHVRLVRPETVEDIQSAVRKHASVIPVGEGHSWNKGFFCASLTGEAEESDVKKVKAKTGKKGKKKNASKKKGKESKEGEEEDVPSTGRRLLQKMKKDAPTAANIAMNAIRPLKIEVDESGKAPFIWVDSGVMVWDLLRYLGNYVTKKAPAGYTLLAPPWFVFQTIGGAVATGTHGSNLKYNSLSSQVLAFRVVLANGTLAEISEETHPFEMKAMRVSVGKLGIITALKMQIMVEVPVKRSLRRGLTPIDLLFMLREAQEMYIKNRSLPEWMVESQIFWLVQIHEFMVYSFHRGDDADPAERTKALKDFEPEETTQYKSLMEMLEVTGDPKIAADKGSKLKKGVFESALEVLEELDTTKIQKKLDLNRTETGKSVADGVKWEEPGKKTANPIYGSQLSATPLFSSNVAALTSLLGNETVEAHLSYISMPEALMPSLVRGTLYDQYEVAIPVDRMADCMEGLLDVVYGDDVLGEDAKKRKLDKGFRTAPLIRFIGKEDAFLSATNDMPRMYMNLEDYLFYNKGRNRNEAFANVIGYLRSNPACATARLHWGKAGWPESGCWHGADEYPDTWCDFGCAVQKLDPEGKFVDSAASRWNWDGADLEYCCKENGYDRSIEGCECNVRRLKTFEECPPAPFYTDR
ncbi:hypothetical protein BSKO_10530 [Bryopsis sp. KO-2023]|nr:hypothetical protein BSKO_10530 [Bryopsis sp. KO-2023]